MARHRLLCHSLVLFVFMGTDTFGPYTIMQLTTRIKQAIYPLYILLKNTLAKKKLGNLYQFYRQQAEQNIRCDHKKHELKIYSNLDEDGIILWLMATLNIRKGFFIDIGSNDCINSNCANLALNFNWDGIFIDSDAALLTVGKRNYALFGRTGNDLHFRQHFVTPANINNILRDSAQREIDFISIDIDGNDYEIFEALEQAPKVFVVENKVEYGKFDIAVTSTNGSGLSPDLFGASPYTMTRLAEAKGYTLVAANKHGFNLFYLRNDLLSSVLQPLHLEHVFSDPLVYNAFYNESYIINILAKLKQ